MNVNNTTKIYSYMSANEKFTQVKELTSSKPQLSKSTKVTISNEAREKFNYHFQEVKGKNELERGFQTFFAEMDKEELVEKIRSERDESPFNDFNVEGVEYVFPEGTLQYTIKQALMGKVKNASLYASELSKAIRASVSMPEMTVEERALYRETALRQAQYVAETYFESEEEGQAFLQDIMKHAQNDILREQGFVVFDNSDLAPFKAYSNPMDKEGNVSFHTLAKQYMDKDYYDQFVQGKGTVKDSLEFMLNLVRNESKYQKEIINNQLSQQPYDLEQIEKIQQLVEQADWNKGSITFSSDVKQLYSVVVDIEKWNQNMLNLFN